MRIQHEFNEDRSQLILTVTPAQQAELREMRLDDPAYWGTHTAEGELLEHLLCNSDLQWVDAEDTGDLTNAPLLGIVGASTQRERSGPYGAVWQGGDEHGELFSPILERWGFMSYAVRSFMDDLADTGRAVFVNEA